MNRQIGTIRDTSRRILTAVISDPLEIEAGTKSHKERQLSTRFSKLKERLSSLVERRIWRLFVLVLIAVTAGALAIFLTNVVVSSMRQDLTAQATVVAGAITVLGLIFSAMYNEISSYYKRRSVNIGKKWDIIFPLLKKHYYPWINSAKAFRNALDRAMSEETVSDETVVRVLYMTMCFYGYRLAFLTDVEAGGLVLLSTSKEEDEVDACYRAIEKAFPWAGGETPRRVSDLQRRWKTKNKPDALYVLQDFAKDLSEDKGLQESKEKMALWLTKENMQKTDEALQKFISTFKKGIDRLYTAWGD